MTTLRSVEDVTQVHPAFVQSTGVNPFNNHQRVDQDLRGVWVSLRVSWLIGLLQSLAPILRPAHNPNDGTGKIGMHLAPCPSAGIPPLSWVGAIDQLPGNPVALDTALVAD
jgi:hypothetical protein